MPLLEGVIYKFVLLLYPKWHYAMVRLELTYFYCLCSPSIHKIVCGNVARNSFLDEHKLFTYVLWGKKYKFSF